MRDHLTYLASPYSHPDPQVVAYRAEQVCRVAGILLARGELVLSPIAHGHPIAQAAAAAGSAAGTNWRTWERLDRRLLEACDSITVLVLPGWRESKGLRAEMAIAEAAGLGLRYVDMEGAVTFARPGRPPVAIPPVLPADVAAWQREFRDIAFRAQDVEGFRRCTAALVALAGGPEAVEAERRIVAASEAAKRAALAAAEG